MARPRPLRFSLLAALVLAAAPGFAGEVTLRNGTVIEGTPVPVSGLTKSVSTKSATQWNHYPILMVETPMQRYFVPQRQVPEDGVDREHFTSNWESFEIPQRPARKTGLTPTSVGSVKVLEPFDRFGRRTVAVSTTKGPVNIIQAITGVSSKFVSVSGLNYPWEFALATTSIPPEVLDPIVRGVLDEDDPEDRLAVVRFYIESGRYIEAGNELAAMRERFPDLNDRIEELELNLRNETAKKLLLDLRRRKSNGQHRLAYQAARQFPRADMRAEVLREVDDLLNAHAEARGKIETVQVLLGEFQSSLSDEQRTALEPLRLELRRSLSVESVPRLESFLTLHADETLPVAEKLSLAYSGWMLGSDHAVTSLERTLNVAQARTLLLEYLRATDPIAEEAAVINIEKIDGITPEVLAWMVPHLPPIRETAGLRVGGPVAITVPDPTTQRETRYVITLPAEYDPAKAYPLIVSIPASGRSAEQQAYWWAGDEGNPLQAQRRGYIVLVPELIDGGNYDYSTTSHDQLFDCIRDASLRFHVDRNRVFLSGHGVGGDAAFDIGLSHPEQFAGVIPICGLSERYTKWYWSNGAHTSWYIVGGELDRGSLERNARDVNQMMRHGHDVIYAEFVGRGFESYYEEIHKLFDWMDRSTRKPLPKVFEAKLLREGDGDWYWVHAQGLPRSVTQADILATRKRRPIRPLELEVTLQDGSQTRTVIYVKPATQTVTLWLSPEILNFDRRLQVNVGSKRAFSGTPSLSVETLMSDLKRRGDRQRLYYGKLELR